jgi:S-formylglutathione hydrolase FrmB
MSSRSPAFPAFIVCFLVTQLCAARVDTVTVRSKAMNKEVKAAVVLPAAYDGRKALPVMYLLHGFSDTYQSWLTRPPEKGLVQRLADENRIIIVCPDGGYGSWYVDSPLDNAFQYETFVTAELVAYVDSNYKTISRREGRLISGLSMGGHGALFLAARHPELYAAAGSIAGSVDLSGRGWFSGPARDWLLKLLGEPEKFQERYRNHSVIYLAGRFKNSGVKLIIDCGTGDFLIQPNRSLHARLLELGIPHEYTERPGMHNWAYFGNSLDYHMVFFRKVLAGYPPLK